MRKVIIGSNAADLESKLNASDVAQIVALDGLTAVVELKTAPKPTDIAFLSETTKTRPDGRVSIERKQELYNGTKSETIVYKDGADDITADEFDKSVDDYKKIKDAKKNG